MLPKPLGARLGAEHRPELREPPRHRGASRVARQTQRRWAGWGPCHVDSLLSIVFTVGIYIYIYI